MAFGLDYTNGPPPSVLKTLRIDGNPVSFVCRYLSFENALTRRKLLTRAEAQANSQAGIATVSNYEWYANRALEGYGSGVQDADIAAKQHATCGGPADRPIYFSVDIDVAGERTAGYFHGVASQIGLARTGAYGSFRVLHYLFNAGLITWGWQTYAWSYGAWEPRAQLQQYHNGVNLAGHDVDYNRSTAADFGQWGVGATKGETMAIDIHTPGMAQEFKEVDAEHWQSLRTGKVIQYAILATYKKYGNADKCGLDYLGHPITNEQVQADGEVIQRFSKGGLGWRKNVGVYPLDLYTGGPGEDPRIKVMLAQIAALNTQIQEEQQKTAPPDPILAQKIEQMKTLEEQMHTLVATL